MPFYGRERELKELHLLLERDSIQNALIYGRRRVGKSDMIKQFCAVNHLLSIHYQCAETSFQDNFNSLQTLIKNVFKEKYLSFASLDDLFDYLVDRSKNQIIFLVLDEYPYWKNVSAGLDSLLQRCLDQSKGSQLKVILCGSSISAMENLDSEGMPLYGRLQLKMEILPFDYQDASFFTKGLSFDDQVRYYSAFGGLPLFLSFIDPKKKL